MRSRMNETNPTQPAMPESGRAFAASARRRGSALVIVVGTLALIAVVAAFYVTLGQADTRVSRGVERGTELEDIERQVAQYIAKIIADDRLAVMVETVTNNETLVGDRFPIVNGMVTTQAADSADRQRHIREATDYPYTDYSKVSMIFDGNGTAPTDNQLRFDPTQYRNMPSAYSGNIADAAQRVRFRAAGDEPYMLDLPDLDAGLAIGNMDDDGLADRRTASDPWLSASEPTFLGRFEVAAPVLGNHDNRNYSQIAFTQSTVANTQDELFYLDNRDWAQITNIAPEGLSVNLWNLRNNFDAESGLGFMATTDANGQPHPRMSENRTLLTANPISMNGVPQLGLRAFDRLHIDPNMAGSILDSTPEMFAIKNTPAWWTMNQRFLYFPADPSFQILGRKNATDRNYLTFDTVQTPEHPDFPDYQYADADGEGMYDSRWFELKDSTLGPNGVADLLSNETGMRFFIAAKVIDLSGKLNLNAATDGLVPSTNAVPAGATPAELDLRRQLTMEDAAERFAPVFANPNAVLGNQRLSYSHIERLPYAQSIAGGAAPLTAGDYERYTSALGAQLSLPSGSSSPQPLYGSSLQTGRYAYDAIRRTIQGDALGLPNEVTSSRSPIIGAGSVSVPLYESSPFEFYSFDPSETANLRSLRNGPAQDSLTPATLADLRQAAVNRRDYYFNIGGANIANPSDSPLTAMGFGGNLFGLEDLAELLTFHGVNDDRVLSRLERTTAGRFDEGSGATATIRFDPLRSNRPTALETSNHDNRINAVPPGDGQAGLGSDNLIDYETMALLALNPRLRLSTLTGAAPLRSRVVEDRDGDGILSADERRLTDKDARLDLTDNPSVQKLFKLYADALIPYSFVDATWANDPEGVLPLFASSGGYSVLEYNQHRTLSYGYRGSELGLRLSAHLAVNMADILDSDDVPSAATVLAAPVAPGTPTPRENLDTYLSLGVNGDESPFSWWNAGNRFDLGDDRLAPDNAELNNPLDANDTSRKAYTVFGVEAQPFVTEVAVVTVYSDVPRERLTSVSGGFDADPRVSDAITRPAERESQSTVYNTFPVQREPENKNLIYNGPEFNPGCLPAEQGYDEGTVDDVNLRFDTSGDNPDLMLHLLAVQVTNPFDVAINLTDDQPAYVEDPTNNQRQIPNQSRVGNLTNAPINDAKYYIEFNGHFFPLVEYIEDTQFRGQINPFVQTGGVGLYRIVLEPGESRVVYVSAHPSLINLTERWSQIEEVYRNQNGEISFTGGPPPDASPETMNATTVPVNGFVQNFIDDQLAVRADSTEVDPINTDADIVYPSRIVPFNPETGQMLQQGNAGDKFVEFMRTNLTHRFPDSLNADPDNEIDRMRQEVRLWRKLTVGDSIPSGQVEGTTYTGGTNPGNNWLGNDLLVDRLRDPLVQQTEQVVVEATLDYGTLDWQNIQNRDYFGDATERYDPFVAPDAFWENTTIPAANNVSIPLTMSTNDNDGSWGLYGGSNQGLTVAMRAGFRRPDHLETAVSDGLLNDNFQTPRGLLPAWCIENTSLNSNIAVPTIEGAALGTNGPHDIAIELIDLAISDEYFGEFFGYRGCHGRDFTNEREGAQGGMFYMNFMRFVKDTKVRRQAGTGLPVVGATRLQSEGLRSQIGSGGAAGTPIDDPMLVPTITRHPALKFTRDEVVTLPADRDGDGRTDEIYDAIRFENMMARNVLPAQTEIRVAVKRTVAQLGADPMSVEPEELFAFDGTKTVGATTVVLDANATLLALGQDGLGDAPDPRDNLVRVGDLALPFAVGPIYAPANPTEPAQNFRSTDWSTLAESLSAAMGYETPAFYNTNPTGPGRWTLLNALVDAKGTRAAPVAPGALMATTPRFQRFFVLDKGRLDLNAFAPFVNRVELAGSMSLLHTLPQFEPTANPGTGVLNASDYRVGFSEPPAQRLFSMATALNRAGGDPLTTPTIGTVNINTASDAVLRSIPGFAPSIQFSRAGIAYDRYDADNGDFTPSVEPMADNSAERVGERTINNAAPFQPIAGVDYEAPFGIPTIFGNWEAQPGGFPTIYRADGWRSIADVPASLVSFRDRSRPSFRAAATRQPVELGGTPPLYGGASWIELNQAFDFSPSLTTITNPTVYPPAATYTPSILDLTVNNYATDFSRNGLNGQGAASERPGLAGVGSLLGISVASSDPLSSTRVDPVNPRLPITGNVQGGGTPRWPESVNESTVQATMTRHGEDRFVLAALDQDENGEADIDPLTPGDEITLNINELPGTPQFDDNFSYTLGRASFWNENPDIEDRQRTLQDEVLDDVLEELAVFNGAANTVDVRSDFFAAWFIIRGYARDDVQGLEADEPMRPSYQKRFLMVLDRSNVTDSGQLPRVLFIREVPL